MKGIELKRTKYVLAAVLLCLAVLAAIGVAHTVNAAGTSGPTVIYDTKTDTLTAKSNSIGYQFYTTAAANKKVPAANKWTMTGDSGTVDMSGVAAGATLYFADSTSPALDEILAVKVPASPTLVSAVYKPSAATMDEMFVFKSKVPVTITTETTNTKTGKVTTKVSKKTEAIVIPHNRIQIRLNDNVDWADFDQAVTSETLKTMQRDSAVIYARVKPCEKTEGDKTATELEAGADANGVYQLADAGSAQVSIANVITTKKNVKTTKVYDTSMLVRYGVSRSIKIARRAVGPTVSIDYANHAMTVRIGQSYGQGTGVSPEPAEWTDNTKANEKIYFGTKGNVTETEYYAVKTMATAKASDSLTTYLEIPADVKFEDTSFVDVSGGFGQNAIMKIRNKSGAKGVAYQYAIVDLNDDKYAGLLNGELKQFDYSNTNVKWTTVKTGKDGAVEVTLTWAKVNGKQVLVRKAAAGNEFSSKVEILNAPGSTDGVAITSKQLDPDPIALACWTKLTQDYYGNGFLANNIKVLFCPYITVAYHGNGMFEIYVYGSNQAISKETAHTLTAKIGSKSYNVRIDKGRVVGSSCDYSMNPVWISDLPARNDNKIVFSFPDGYSTARYMLDNKNYDGKSTRQSYTLIADTKRPVVKKAVINRADQTLLLTFDSQIRLNGVPIKEVGQQELCSSSVTMSAEKVFAQTYITCKSIDKKTGETTISVPYKVYGTSADKKMTVTLKNYTDMAGNNLESATIECENPAYSE